MPACATFGHGGRFRALLVCDHGSRQVPRALQDLGLSEAALCRHIAWDIGALDLSVGLSERLGIRGVAAGFSRLVIDCNRRLEDPTSIPCESDGELVPGNLGLDDAARAARQREYFWPYHTAIAAELERLVAPPRVPALIAIHSFTPTMNGFERPWHCGILWDRDARMPAALLRALRARGDVEVGDNEPYSGRDPEGYTVEEHADRRGWPHVCIEVRQDLLAHPDGVARWVAVLGAALEPLLADDELYRVRG